MGILNTGPANLITNWKQVRPGTNGGVTVLGLIFSAAGGLLVGLTGWLFAVVGHGSSEVRPAISLLAARVSSECSVHLIAATVNEGWMPTCLQTMPAIISACI